MTTRSKPTGGDTVAITCAPRYDGTEEVIRVPREWLSTAEKLVDAGTRRRSYSTARGGERLQRLNDTWNEIRALWALEAKPLGMSMLDASMLLGISRQGLDNILNDKVGGNHVRMDPQRPPSVPTGTSHIRAWAQENGLDVAPFGPIRREVLEAYMQAHGR